MGKLSLDAVKCKYCGEWVEEKKEQRNRFRREDRETAEREVRRTLQDKAQEQMKSDKSGRPESAQKGISESKGIKSWWTAQSGVSKGILVLFVGLIAFGGIYLASGSDQDVPGTNPIDQISPSTGSSSDGSTSVKACTVCGGDGILDCSKCGGDTIVVTSKECTKPGCIGGRIQDTSNSAIWNDCPACVGGVITSEETCEICHGTGKVKCTNCGGDGKIGN
ncbi:hypothetical protein [Methanobacterium oryzae]|uniref:hypothetical protein n=1 Tax=Methanobacterium oryzae TaxID=69540 RepID=UPI003D203B69